MLRHWAGMENMVYEAAQWMIASKVTPQQVVDAYLKARPARTPENSFRRALSSRAGDLVVLPAACPRCGADVEMLQLCPQASPVWRTQLACMADGCAWHGKSKLPIAVLAGGAANIKTHVTEG